MCFEWLFFWIFSTIFGSLFDPVWGCIGPFLGFFGVKWGHFAIILGSFWPYGTGSCQGYCALDHGEGGCGWDHPDSPHWVALGPLCHHFGIVFASFCFRGQRQDSLPSPGCQHGGVHTDDFCPEALCARLRCFRGLRIPEKPFSDGACIPIEGAFYCYGDAFSPWASHPRPVLYRYFSGVLPYPKRRQVVYAIQPDGGYIPKAFATILLTCHVLFTPMGSGCNPPTAFREVFAFDKRVSRCIALRALSLWLP